MQAILEQTKFQSYYGQALSVRVNGGFIVISDANTGVMLDWVHKQEFAEVIKDATAEESGTLTIDW